MNSLTSRLWLTTPAVKKTSLKFKLESSKSSGPTTELRRSSTTASCQPRTSPEWKHSSNKKWSCHSHWTTSLRLLNRKLRNTEQSTRKNTTKKKSCCKKEWPLQPTQEWSDATISLRFTLNMPELLWALTSLTLSWTWSSTHLMLKRQHWSKHLIKDGHQPNCNLLLSKYP